MDDDVLKQERDDAFEILRLIIEEWHKMSTSKDRMEALMLKAYSLIGYDDYKYDEEED